MNFLKVILLFFLLLSIAPSSNAKKRCKALLDTLHNVQAMQRNGYSAQRAASLRVKEDKARNKWWQCEQGKKVKKKKQGKSKENNKSKNKQIKRTYRQKKTTKKSANLAFKTNNAIVIKSKYQGKKQKAWLKSYHQPSRCKRPKNLAVFAFCSEDKQIQRIHFDKSYGE